MDWREAPFLFCGFHLGAEQNTWQLNTIQWWIPHRKHCSWSVLMMTNVSSVRIWLHQSNSNYKRLAPTLWLIFSFIDVSITLILQSSWIVASTSWKTCSCWTLQGCISLCFLANSFQFLTVFCSFLIYVTWCWVEVMVGVFLQPVWVLDLCCFLPPPPHAMVHYCYLPYLSSWIVVLQTSVLDVCPVVFLRIL